MLAPEGYKILQADVRKLFRNEDSLADFDSNEMCPLTEIIQEVLQKHVQGISFRERGAGANLDKDMTPQGFNVRVGVDPQTGFVYGGSVYNCGTWMDKVGESSWAGNKGVPSTPRYSCKVWGAQQIDLQSNDRSRQRPNNNSCFPFKIV